MQARSFSLGESGNLLFIDAIDIKGEEKVADNEDPLNVAIMAEIVIFFELRVFVEGKLLIYFIFI